ncbi:MAG: hypothetical protein K8S15_12180 [Candidatus Aegiribacteria sp.]|nr:hypothetical protein [Candidatus Aegiribacteria sp.]
MRWMLMLLVLACAIPVVAGEIVIGICDECGYQTDEFFAGYGMTPGYVAEVYRDPETGEFQLVGFDIVLIVAENIAVTLNNNYREIEELTVEEIAVNINNNYRGIGMETAEEIAVNINNNYRETGEINFSEIAVTLNNNYHGIEKLVRTLRSPDVLGELILDDELPAGVLLGEDPTGNPMSWELISLNDSNLCPACVGKTLIFERVGHWN